jgi:hypothetical protein
MRDEVERLAGGQREDARVRRTAAHWYALGAMDTALKDTNRMGDSIVADQFAREQERAVVGGYAQSVQDAWIAFVDSMPIAWREEMRL